MRLFVALLVPAAISLLNTGVQAATISSGVVSRESDLVARRQFHNVDFNSGSSASHPHGKHGRSNAQKSPRSLSDSSDALSPRQVDDVTSLPGDAAAQASTVIGSTPVGGTVGTLPVTTASRRQTLDTSDPLNSASNVLNSTPVGSTLGSLPNPAKRRQLSAIPLPVDSVPSLPDPSALIGSADVAGVAGVADVASGNSTARELKDVAEEDIEAADDDIDHDLKDIPQSFEVLSNSTDLSKDDEVHLNERRQANVTALQAAVLDQELIQSLNNATNQG